MKYTFNLPSGSVTHITGIQIGNTTINLEEPIPVKKVPVEHNDENWIEKMGFAIRQEAKLADPSHL